MKILIDMNLSPTWLGTFRDNGIEAQHWLNVGRKDAPDKEILAWAKERGYTVFTNDLDFSAIMAATSADAPSVIQLRTQALLPSAISEVVLAALKQFESDLLSGAIIVINDTKTRARILPLGDKS